MMKCPRCQSEIVVTNPPHHTLNALLATGSVRIGHALKASPMLGMLLMIVAIVATAISKYVIKECKCGQCGHVF